MSRQTHIWSFLRLWQWLFFEFCAYVCFLDLLDCQSWGMQQEALRFLRERMASHRARGPRGPRDKQPERNSRCHLKKSWRNASTLCWWVANAWLRAASGKSKSATIERNKECGICWKCARPRDKLIVVPGTQSCCEKIHKSSFMLRLTAALGSLLPVRERMIRGSQVCLQLSKRCLYSLLLYLSTYTSTYKSLMYQSFTNERRLRCQKYPWILGKRQCRLGHMLHHLCCLIFYLVKCRCLKLVLVSLLKVITLLFL